VLLLQGFLLDVIKSSNEVLLSSITVALILTCSVPTTIIAGKLSDHIGRKKLVYASTALMAVCCCGFCIVSYFPSTVISLVLAGIIGIGYGSYQSVDRALVLDVLPPNANVAKDLGIWHISFVLPQVIAPVIAGAILTEIKKTSIALAYASIWGVTGIWFILATVFIYPVRLKRDQQINSLN